MATITTTFLSVMISFVTNTAAPFGTVWKQHYGWVGMMDNTMNSLAYLFMGIPAGMIVTKYGYKETVLVALALGFIGTATRHGLSRMNRNEIGTYVVHLVGTFICGFCVCILNTVVNPTLNLLGGGGNHGNQLIQTGGSLNSLAAALTPILTGSIIDEITKETSLRAVAPLLLIALVIFVISFVAVWFTQLTEPEAEETDVVDDIKEALRYHQLLLGIIAIFFYVGVEVGIPGQLFFYLSELVAKSSVPDSVAATGLIAGVYWVPMLVDYFVSAFISGKVSSRTQLTVTSVVALLLLLVAILMPEDAKINLSIPNLTESIFDQVEVPTRVLFIILYGIYTSAMWDVIFNLATEGLGKYTATASGLFIAMVAGGGVILLIQNLMTTKVGDTQSYWLTVGMLAYVLFYALVGSHPSEKT